MNYQQILQDQTPVLHKFLDIDIGAEANGLRGVDITHAIQGDTDSRFITVRLWKNNKRVNLTGWKVRFSGQKPSGFNIFNNCTILDAANGIFMVPLTSQTLAESHILRCMFHFFTNDETKYISTQTFTVTVDKTLLDWAAVESSNEFQAALVLFQEVKSALDLIQAVYDLVSQLNLSNLSRLDANVSSRAPANTALSNAVWTNARAGFLDELNGGVLTRRSLLRILEISAPFAPNQLIAAFNGRGRLIGGHATRNVQNITLNNDGVSTNITVPAQTAYIIFAPIQCNFNTSLSITNGSATISDSAARFTFTAELFQ
jgi:hypothetical protein